MSNVPIIRLQNFVKPYKSYANDALYVSLYNPIKHSPRMSCSINQKYHDRQITLKNIKQIIFNNHLKVNRKCTCPKQDIQPRKRKKIIPNKKFISIHPEKHQPRSPSILSYRISPTPPSSLNKITPVESPVNIISHTRFGKSMLALYFQKYRFTSPIKTSKKDQFLHLLKSNP